MASRSVPASILECTSPMVSALGMGWPQPTLPEPGCARHLQSVEASQPRPKQDYGGLGYRGRGDTRLRPAVGDGGNEQGGEMEHLIRVCDQAPKQVRASSPGDVSIPVRTLLQ